MADEIEREASHSNDSFVQDGQEQSAAAIAREWLSQFPDIRVFNVPESPLVQGAQHRQRDQDVSPDPALAHRRTSNRPPGDRSWVDESRREPRSRSVRSNPETDRDFGLPLSLQGTSGGRSSASHTGTREETSTPRIDWNLPGPHWDFLNLWRARQQQAHSSRAQPPSGPSRRDRAEAGPSRAPGASHALSSRASMSSYVSSNRNRSRSSLRRSEERQEGEGNQEARGHSTPQGTPLSSRREEGSRDSEAQDSRRSERSLLSVTPQHTKRSGRSRTRDRTYESYTPSSHRGRNERRDSLHSSRVSRDQPRYEEENQPPAVNLRTVQGMINATLARGDYGPPPAARAPSFQSQVASHSSAPQDVLGRLKNMYRDKIKHVNNTSTKAKSYVYDYEVPREGGFWSTPKPTLPYNRGTDPYGSFKTLVAPTISKHWSFSSEPQLEEVVEGENQSLEEKHYKGMDALAQSAVPGRCTDKEIDAFLSSKPLTKYAVGHHVTGTGRYLEVDEEIFPLTRYVKCDSENLIPSLEHKARLIARDGFSALDMLKAQEAKTSPLYANWNSPGIWDPEKGVSVDENGTLVVPENRSVLADSVSKEDLLLELYHKSDLSKLAIMQLEHQTKLSVAMHAELKIFMREILLFNAMPRSSNQTLVEIVRNSQLSVPQLIGPIPSFYRDKLQVFPHQGNFKPFSPPNEIRFMAPVKKQSFRGRPGPSKRRFPARQAFQPKAYKGFKRGRGGNFIARPAKNRARGGKPHASLASQSANQEAGASGRGRGKGKGRGRGGKASRRGRGKNQ